jgi:uncharacterized membrane protein
MNTYIEILKRKLLENIVYVVIFAVGFIYLLVKGERSELGFIIVFPPWFVFAFSFFSVLVDWKLLKYFKLWILVSFIIGLLTTMLLLYFGWRDEVYVYLMGACGIGFASVLVLKVASAVNNNR